MLSSGIDRKTAEKLGFLYACSPQEGLDTAFAIKGKTAKVAVIENGGELMPIIHA